MKLPFTLVKLVWSCSLQSVPELGAISVKIIQPCEVNRRFIYWISKIRVKGLHLNKEYFCPHGIVMTNWTVKMVEIWSIGKTNIIIMDLRLFEYSKCGQNVPKIGTVPFRESSIFDIWYMNLVEFFHRVKLSLAWIMISCC